MPLFLRNVAIIGATAVALGAAIIAEWIALAPIALAPLGTLPLTLARVSDRMEQRPPAKPDPVRMQAQVATVLARPLFTQGRRPTMLDAAPASTSVELPRLAGVMVSAQGSSAVFAGAEGGKAVVIGTGASIGAFKVQKIEAGQVTLIGADGGTRLLRPSFDPGRIPARADVPGPKDAAVNTLVAPRPRPAVVTRSAPPGLGSTRQTRPSPAPSRQGAPP